MVEDRLTERYVLESRIALGGMGGVYVALDERLDRRVAIKVLKDELAHDPRFVERFRREARSVAALSHPNVATVYDYGEEEGRHFIVMELVEGRDLARVLREEGPFDPERAARVAAGVARALEHAHAAGVIHRDVKPANIMLSPGDRVKVTDFGIARAVGESSLTATGSVMGTAQYISPEQASSEDVSPQSDTYSLGIVLFEMLTGTVPFTGDNALAIAMKHVSESVPAPSERNPHLPEALDQIVARAAKRHPGDRHTAGAMADELDSIAVSLEAGGDTAELGPEDEHEQTVWPIPGTRYDPETLGRRVIRALVALAVIALALLVWRVGSTDGDNNEGRDGRGAGALATGLGTQESTSATVGSPSASPTPAGVALDDYEGRNYKDVAKELEDAGIVVEKVDVDDEAEKDTILSQSKEPGTVVEEGDTVTLTVSTGEVPEDTDDDEPGNGKGKAKGHDKEKD